MLTSLIILGFILSGFASPFKRATSLIVSLTGPATNITSIDDLKFTAIVFNTGSEPVRILKYGTILDDILPTRSLTVTKDRQTVPFTGIKLTISLEDIDDSAFAIISPGESVTVNRELSTLFDFASAGPGTFTFAPVTSFQTVSPEARITDAGSLDLVTVSSSSVDVHVSGDLAKRDLPVLDARAVDICTSSSQKSFIDASYTEAKSLASIASSYIATNGANSLYTAYYGATSTSTIRGVFNNVASESSRSRTYTFVASFSEVPSTNLCRGTSVASRNVRGGTTLHELTHATSGTDDVIYGCANDQALSDANQRINADNYNCFSTQVYQNTQC
ncbi:Metalloprotease [Armillaria luteobubalina]|uniref:deuterolysin n=1 Tax=Armillaria luteobubalina TaxID=153913 RepID=A0AA39PYJ2_9AGAR|nr:Metalloprotease [Armillaria luteobubalina]